MSRNYCQLCLRPEVSCICKFMISTANDLDIIILQHPSEVKQSKATVPLLAGSLIKCHVFIGEDFKQNDELQHLLGQYQDNIALLYPSESAHVISKDIKLSTQQSIRCLVLLDGTWKKAYRLYQLNPFLHSMKHLSLSNDYHGQYQIRKTRKIGALSTLEACCYALSVMENCKDRYAPLLENFVAFNEFQQRFVPINQVNNPDGKRLNE
ncbi:tRNA-uridine aminocarboxypropyltransferase [Thalassotalea piscium]